MIRPPPRFTLFPYPPLFRFLMSEPPPLMTPVRVSRVAEATSKVPPPLPRVARLAEPDRKSTRLNSSHDQISYAVFCLKKKKKKETGTILSAMKSQLTYSARR